MNKDEVSESGNLYLVEYRQKNAPDVEREHREEYVVALDVGMAWGLVNEDLGTYDAECECVSLVQQGIKVGA